MISSPSPVRVIQASGSAASEGSFTKAEIRIPGRSALDTTIGILAENRAREHRAARRDPLPIGWEFEVHQHRALNTVPPGM